LNLGASEGEGIKAGGVYEGTIQNKGAFNRLDPVRGHSRGGGGKGCEEIRSSPLDDGGNEG